MRLYNKILLGAVALSSLTTTSCLKDQKDLFCDEPSVRLEKRMQECQQTLTGSEYGWIMDYYPDRDKSYGGFVYGLKFTDAETTVTCELAPGETETSYYKMTNDNGPVLSFDTYNTLMHFFATPSGNRYEAYDGDFEFIILDITPDLITLKGNRTGNTIYMHRATSDIVDYVTKSSEIGEAIFQTEFKGTCGADEVYAVNDLGTRYMEFQWKVGEGDTAKIETSGSYYVPTPTGIRFMEPAYVTAKSGEVTELSFDMANYVFTGTDSQGNAVTLNGVVAPSYAFYNEYIGEFTLTYNTSRNINIQVVNDGSGSGYIIKGLSNKFDVAASYNKSIGALCINSQQVAIEGSTAYWVCAWDLDGGGNLTWSTDAGAMFVKDPDNPGEFVMADNSDDYDPSFNTDSFIVWTLNASTSASTGQAAAPWVFANGSTQLPRILKITKK